MEAKARQTNIKMTARKLRRVINEVRGKAVNDALDMLRFMPYFAARVVEKNLKAAAANGWIDEERIVGEMATGAFRSGAQIYLTYYAELLARLMDEGRIG